MIDERVGEAVGVLTKQKSSAPQRFL